MLETAPAKGGLFFMHIPKTGGRTVIRHLDQWYDGAVVEIPTNEDIIGNAGWLDGRVICGHQFYPFRDVIGGRPNTLVVLREPVSRVLSAFRYIERKNEHVLRGDFDARISSLTDFIVDREFRFHSVNMQVRMLGSAADLRRLVVDYEAGRLSALECRRHYHDALAAEADVETLERAKERLRREDVTFGLTEQMDEFVRSLARGIELPMPQKIYRANAAPAWVDPRATRRQVRDADIELARHENYLDIELYSFAVSMLASTPSARTLDLGP